MPGIIRVRRPPLLYRRPAIVAASLLDGSESDGTQLLGSTLNAADFSGAGWSQYNTGLVTNDALAPDGNTVAAKFYSNAANDRHLIYSNGVTVVANDTFFTVSVYAKYTSLRYLQILPATSGSNKLYAYFDLQTGSVTDSGTIGSTTLSATSCQAGVNGFYKCSLSGKINSGGGSLDYVQFCISDRSTHSAPLTFDSPQYTGAGTGSWMHVWRPKVTSP